MNTNEPDDKYKEIFQEIKEDKMKWDFEDFLAETEKEKKIVPLTSGKIGGSMPKMFWMAASLVFLLGLGIFFNYETENIPGGCICRPGFERKSGCSLSA